MQNILKQQAESMKDLLATWRHEFHRCPELGYEEFETTKKIVALLTEMGYANLRVGGRELTTGVIADIDTGRPGKKIALRADIDALPVAEETDVPFRSERPGFMHACGHDAHITMLLGAAKMLIEHKAELNGSYRLIFQPAEEKGNPGGAARMIESGVLDGVDAICGLHIWSPVPSGKIAYREGPTMASADSFLLTIKGKGGHGSMPHLSVDPVTCACAVVSAWQTIVSREVDPLEAGVISVGAINAGKVFNVIPENVSILGTTRTFRPEIRDYIESRMKTTAELICEAMRCTAEFAYTRFLPPTVTDPAFTKYAVEIAKEVAGAENVYEMAPTMGAEDFSYYLEKIPGTFLFLGTGNPAIDANYPQHHPKYKVDDDVLPLGVATMAGVAMRYLGRS